MALPIFTTPDAHGVVHVGAFFSGPLVVNNEHVVAHVRLTFFNAASERASLGIFGPVEETEKFGRLADAIHAIFGVQI